MVDAALIFLQSHTSFHQIGKHGVILAFYCGKEQFIPILRQVCPSLYQKTHHILPVLLHRQLQRGLLHMFLLSPIHHTELFHRTFRQNAIPKHFSNCTLDLLEQVTGGITLHFIGRMAVVQQKSELLQIPTFDCLHQRWHVCISSFSHSHFPFYLIWSFLLHRILSPCQMFSSFNNRKYQQP